jgi:hemoglobin
MSTSLYERLGGGEKIRAIASGVVDLHMSNPAIMTRFLKIDPENLKRLAAEFFSHETGGPEIYMGRDIRSAHEGLNVSEAEFLAAVDDILEVLKKYEIGKGEMSEVLTILYGMKGDIIHV